MIPTQSRASDNFVADVRQFVGNGCFFIRLKQDLNALLRERISVFSVEDCL